VGIGCGLTVKDTVLTLCAKNTGTPTQRCQSTGMERPQCITGRCFRNVHKARIIYVPVNGFVTFHPACVKVIHHSILQLPVALAFGMLRRFT
jgi:hypothetical protein